MRGSPAITPRPVQKGLSRKTAMVGWKTLLGRGAFHMIVGIILSAGESKRMGTPKQLLPWGNTIVLQRVLDVASASRLETIRLILGYRAEEIAGRITVPEKARIVVNQDFREGMGSSVKCGIRNCACRCRGLHGAAGRPAAHRCAGD